MPDRGSRTGDNPSAEMDFTGLLPGDEQPRRRRRARSDRRTPSETPAEPEAGAGDSGARSEEPGEPANEQPGTPGDEPDEVRVVGEGDAGAAPPGKSSTGDDRERGKSDPYAPSTAPLGGSEPASTEGEESNIVPARGSAKAAGPEPRGAPLPPLPVRGEEAPGSPDQGYPPSGGPSETRDEAPRPSPEGQAALIEGQDLDRILQRISSLSPEQRSAYKSSIMLSEAHYELLTDLRKDFRRRGFTGMETTMSNVIAIGLEVVRQSLDAEKNLPGS